jgi:hypothetical protein
MNPRSADPGRAQPTVPAEENATIDPSSDQVAWHNPRGDQRCHPDPSMFISTMSLVSHV